MLPLTRIVSDVAHLVDEELDHEKKGVRERIASQTPYTADTFSSHLRTASHLLSLIDLLAVADYYGMTVDQYLRQKLEELHLVKDAEPIAADEIESAGPTGSELLTLDVSRYQDKTLRELQRIASASRMNVRIVLEPAD